MRHFRLTPLLSAVAVALFLGLPVWTAAEPETDPPSADDLVARSSAYHDPAGHFLGHAHRLTFRETRPDGDDRHAVVVVDVPGERFVHSTGDPPIQSRLFGTACSFVIDGREPTTEERETHRLACDRLVRRRDYYTFLWGLPMKLRDPGTRLGPVEAATFEGEPTWQLRVTWDEAVGTDIWYFYFDVETARMVGYRFYHDEAAGDGEVIVLSGELEAAGMRLPAERAWTTHLDDRYLGTDILTALEALP